MSDFSLMDAIECGIVKLPRVPVADNIPGDEMPMFRNLWEHIRQRMPKKGRGKAATLDPLELPAATADRAGSALRPLREDLRALGRDDGITVPPCFIVVCNNTSTSKLVYDYISGFQRENDDGSSNARRTAACALFRNFDEHGNPLAAPEHAADRQRAARIRRGAGRQLPRHGRRRDRTLPPRDRRTHRRLARQAENLTDQDLLREVMNTVGKHGQLGGRIRCVVSVSMLTEGWDANTVTHVLGVRAFGTQLLCEQVIGRALRRQSYDLNEEDLFNVEYADVLGIPFDFTAKPVVAPPQPPRETIQVKAVRPDRDALEIRFPRVEGYRVELPEERLTAEFNDDSILELTPDLVGATETRNSGIIGESVDLNLVHTRRHASLHAALSTSPQRLLYTKWRDPGDEPQAPPLRPAQAHHQAVARQRASSARAAPIRRSSCIRSWPTWPASGSPPASPAQLVGKRPIKALLDPYNPTGSTAHVSFNTSKTDRWETDATPLPRQLGHPRQRLGSRVLPRGRVAPARPAYVKNHNLGLEVPYRYGSETRTLPARTSSCWWTTATATTTCCT